MARTQAADYDQRRAAITRTAAALYARHGFLGASVAQVAAACNTSKSLIYHYYPSKEDILFDVMDSHVQALAAAARTIEASDTPPREKVAALARDLMTLYAGAEAHQTVLLNELANLPDARRAQVVAHQRALLDMVDRLIVAIRPDLAARPGERRALTMLFFGMLNWTHIWFDPAGPVSGAAIADRAAAMFLCGIDAT